MGLSWTALSWVHQWARDRPTSSPGDARYPTCVRQSPPDCSNTLLCCTGRHRLPLFFFRGRHAPPLLGPSRQRGEQLPQRTPATTATRPCGCRSPAAHGCRPSPAHRTSRCDSRRQRMLPRAAASELALRGGGERRHASANTHSSAMAAAAGRTPPVASLGAAGIHTTRRAAKKKKKEE